MGLTWVQNPESRADLAISVIQMESVGTPAFSDYPTGGYSVPPSAFGLSGSTGIRAAWPSGYTGAALNYSWRYNKTSRKLQVYTADVEVAASTNIAGSVTVIAQGY